MKGRKLNSGWLIAVGFPVDSDNGSCPDSGWLACVERDGPKCVNGGRVGVGDESRIGTRRARVP